MVIMYTQEGESKYHVANILSSMANGGPPSVQITYAIPSSAYSSISGSAPSSGLTPTTLNNLEQTFIELQSVQSNSTTTTSANHITQSGFMPPVVSSSHSTDNDYAYMSDSCSSSDSFMPSEPKKIKIGDKTTTIMSKYEIENPQRKTHRRQFREEEVSPEEAVRRNMRRERNKVAAAKCRQRRVDHTNRLLNETDKLEQEQQSIENELQSLRQERDQLEFILQAHGPLCKVNRNGISTPSIKIKSDPDRSEKKDMSSKLSTTKELSLTSRPSTLSLIKREMKLDHPAAGISITTPSSGFYSFSLDTMVDHTGLTPLTGHTGLTPLTSMPSSCSTEVSKKNSTASVSENSDVIKTPSSLLTL